MKPSGSPPKKRKKSKPKSRHRQVPTQGNNHLMYDRMLRIHQLLCAGALPTHEYLVVELGVSLSTVKRDIRYLRDRMQRPVAFNRKRGGLEYTEPNVDFPFLQISERELIALGMAEQVIEACRGTALGEAFRSAYRKLAREVSNRFRYTPEQIAESFSLVPLGYRLSGNPKVFDIFAAAIVAQEEVEFYYANFPDKERKLRRVHPLHLKNHGFAWTLFTYDPSRGCQRSFVLSRAHDARLTGVGFTKTAAHNWRDSVAHSIGTYCSGPVMKVRLRLSPAPHLLLTEKPVHPSQVITEMPDGTVELSVTVAINPEFEAFVMSWGSQVRTLEPASLRRTVAAHWKQIWAWEEEALEAEAREAKGAA